MTPICSRSSSSPERPASTWPGDHHQIGQLAQRRERPYQSTRPVMFLMRSSRAMVNSSGLSRVASTPRVSPGRSPP
jgi:hypothetical protein